MTKRGRKRIDITGKKFGRLTAIEIDYSVEGRTYWRCKCECGNETSVIIAQLNNGRTKSCGCLLQDVYNRGLQLKAQCLDCRLTPEDVPFRKDDNPTGYRRRCKQCEYEYNHDTWVRKKTKEAILEATVHQLKNDESLFWSFINYYFPDDYDYAKMELALLSTAAKYFFPVQEYAPYVINFIANNGDPKHFQKYLAQEAHPYNT